MGCYLGNVIVQSYMPRESVACIYILTYGICIVAVTASSIIIQFVYMYFANFAFLSNESTNNSTLVER